MNMKMNMIFVTADHFHIIYGEWLDEHEKNKPKEYPQQQEAAAVDPKQ